MLTVTEAVERFIANLRSCGSSPNTVKSYENDLRHFIRHVPMTLNEVDARAVRTFLDNDAHSPATKRRRHATLSAFYRWIIYQELTTLNPMERVESSKMVARLPRPISPERVEAILRVIPASATRDRALFTLLYETGIRVGEALGLQATDVDLTQDDEKVRVLGKGSRERMVLLAAAPRSIRLLRRHLQSTGICSGSVFRGDPRYGGSNLPVDYTTIRRAWARYCKKAGVSATIHQLRHSRASELVQAGVPLGTIRKQLGHRNIQSTMIYAEVAMVTVKHDLLEFQRKSRGSR